MKKLIVFLMAVVGFSGCAQNPKVAIVHEYVIERAQLICAQHEGLHYIVPQMEIYTKDKDGSYPCIDRYSVRCQDQTLFTFDTEIAYCDVAIMQYDETTYDDETRHVKVN